MVCSEKDGEKSGPQQRCAGMKTCIKCGGTHFYDDGHCKSCAVTRAVRWTKNNPEKRIAIGRHWRMTNPEKSSAASKKYLIANSEKVTARKKKWYINNKEAWRIYKQNRRERERNGGGALSKDLAEKLLKLQKGKCACCGLPLGDDFQLDHQMPVALGGENKDGNIQLLRRLCNQQKSSKHSVDFMRSRGFLL